MSRVYKETSEIENSSDYELDNSLENTEDFRSSTLHNNTYEDYEDFY